jgi:hypothetical protein
MPSGHQGVARESENEAKPRAIRLSTYPVSVPRRINGLREKAQNRTQAVAHEFRSGRIRFSNRKFTLQVQCPGNAAIKNNE